MDISVAIESPAYFETAADGALIAKLIIMASSAVRPALPLDASSRETNLYPRLIAATP